MANKSAKQLSTARRKNWQTTLQQSAANRNLGARPLVSVVLDSNIWISAILFGGNSEGVLRFCLSRAEIVASDALAEEIFSYFQYQTKAPQRWRRFFRISFEKICSIVPTNNEVGEVRDPKDNHVIAAALAGKCQFIVTGDRDLLELQEYKGAAIVTPVDFLRYTGKPVNN